MTCIRSHSLTASATNDLILLFPLNTLSPDISPGVRSSHAIHIWKLIDSQIRLANKSPKKRLTSATRVSLCMCTSIRLFIAL